MATAALLVLAFFTVTGCSPRLEAPPAPRAVTEAPQDTTVDFVELFMVRSSATEGEFEQYKVSPQGVFVECGTVNRGKVKPEHQSFRSVAGDRFARVAERAQEFLGSAERTGEVLPSPGTGRSMFDPGALTLSIGTSKRIFNIKTSVDAVSDGSAGPLLRLKNLVREVRGVVEDEACGGKVFFGIAPQNPPQR